MVRQEQIEDFILNGHKEYIPHVSLDCAIFGYHEQQLKLLLIKHKAIDGWCLPGGYIKRTEKLVEAAARNVRERTGIDNLFLQQFKTFGDPNRARFEEFDEERWYEATGVRVTRDNWLIDQTISIGFYSITDFSRTTLQPDVMSVECEWFDIDALPPLEFDHDEMVQEALHTMRIHLYHYPIGYNMLPEKFTLTEIHALYETLLGKKLDISNFPKKLIALGLLTKLDEKRSIGPHRSPHLYKFDKERYDEALKNGVVLS
ncbi:NUDIX hydrolase [Mucilaginibacter pedocola]|uniref:NUDIX hydrolase n=1 Tax=Mucilaginibacter pedocola TaxID=1792845 RepID=A0A1S9PI95_9SPHI|nr:NUDIX domain-containing protein [Mucilaginibacter pedocola]OOQ60669.1 NUDIX hydrolase [Mucilaginibacter pedocola]